MMLHEAVMLEIYRQALNASELVSPRCQSRESSTSGVAVAEGRCPSNDSVYSAHESAALAAGATTPINSSTPVPTTTSSPMPAVEIPLPAALPPNALLPQQSAAMAAYINAANQLFLTNPLAASLVHTGPNMDPRRLLTATETALDFSVKSEVPKTSDEDEEEEEEEDDEEENTATSSTGMSGSEHLSDLCAPLDLSCTNRKRQSTDTHITPNSPSKNKIARINDFKAWATPSINPYLAVVAAANLSPKMQTDWKKHTNSETVKAIERMTEMSRLGMEKADPNNKQSNNSPTQLATPLPTTMPAQTNGSGNGGRHSAWQSHWLNKGAHSVKDVFKCVWCKQSFPTLASLTTHMKETKHCGVNVCTPTSQTTNTATNMPHSTANSSHNQNNTHNTNNNNNSKKSDLNLLIKETMPLPRKLVRGQDVWLGKGAEQTRQILKCMWCGQSFRSLAEMTAHMQETQHYTNIISQEQIISWKSTDDKNSNGATSPNSTNSNSGNATGGASISNTVSAVLTCKVCDQAFPTLKDLSNHMVKNSHYKEPMLRQTSESPNLSLQRRGRQMREKRKKSLPVRKLLELERAGGDYTKTSNNNVLDPALKPLRDFAASTKISCEKCGEKIETALFVEHIRQCLGGQLLATPRKSSIYSPGKHTEDNTHASPLSSTPSTDILPPMKEIDKGTAIPSVLMALEQLIEKSFDTRTTRNYGSGATNSTPLGSSILKRLGIDDTVDYTKPLMDVHALRMRSNSNFHGSRDRSGSESSSISERCTSSYLEAMTPDRQLDISRQTTPRLQTPDKYSEIKIKSEPITEAVKENLTNYSNESQIENNDMPKITVKKEFIETQNTDGDSEKNEKEAQISPVHSPKEKKLIGSSLNALNSMFNSLNNTLNFSHETNNNNMSSHNNNNNTINNNINPKTKKSNANPLAALQKLCDTTTDPPTTNTRGNNLNAAGNAAANSAAGGVSSTMLSYCWDAETMSKCAYCDTTFYTKGAYKHHLLKVHYVKEDALGDMQQSPKSTLASPRSTSKSPAASPTSNVPTINPYEESPQSKFRKYTELAKQLSSKNN